MYATSGQAKKEGWFSRRHQSDEAHKDQSLWECDRANRKRVEAEERQEVSRGAFS